MSSEIRLREDLKIIHLFDALDKMDEYDEAELLKKNKRLTKQQLIQCQSPLIQADSGQPPPDPE